MQFLFFFFIHQEIAYVKIMRMKIYVTVLRVNATNARMDYLEEVSVQKVCILKSIINIKLFTVSGSREIISFITHLLESSQYPKEDRGNLHTNILGTSCEGDTKVRTNYSRVQNPCDQLYSATLFNFSPKTI